jgi:hypothetical protein
MLHDTKDQAFDHPSHVEQKQFTEHFEDAKLPVNEGLHQVRDVGGGRLDSY